MLIFIAEETLVQACRDVQAEAKLALDRSDEAAAQRLAVIADHLAHAYNAGVDRALTMELDQET